jgi:hypothetical protein
MNLLLNRKVAFLGIANFYLKNYIPNENDMKISHLRSPLTPYIRTGRSKIIPSLYTKIYFLPDILTEKYLVAINYYKFLAGDENSLFTTRTIYILTHNRETRTFIAHSN